MVFRLSLAIELLIVFKVILRLLGSIGDDELLKVGGGNLCKLGSDLRVLCRGGDSDDVSLFVHDASYGASKSFHHSFLAFGEGFGIDIPERFGFSDGGVFSRFEFVHDPSEGEVPPRRFLMFCQIVCDGAFKLAVGSFHLFCEQRYDKVCAGHDVRIEHRNDGIAGIHCGKIDARHVCQTVESVFASADGRFGSEGDFDGIVAWDANDEQTCHHECDDERQHIFLFVSPKTSEEEVKPYFFFCQGTALFFLSGGSYCGFRHVHVVWRINFQPINS